MQRYNILSINKLQHSSFKQRSREIRIFCKYALHSVQFTSETAPNRVQFCCFLYLFSILSNIERNANMDTAPVSTQPLLWLQSRLLFKHGFSVGINQKPAFYAKECQFHRVNGLNSPRIVLLIVDSPFEIEKVFIAF